MLRFGVPVCLQTDQLFVCPVPMLTLPQKKLHILILFEIISHRLGAYDVANEYETTIQLIYLLYYPLPLVYSLPLCSTSDHGL